jgi:hypothetical protein
MSDSGIGPRMRRGVWGDVYRAPPFECSLCVAVVCEALVYRRRTLPGRKIYCSEPTWENHGKVVADAGVSRSTTRFPPALLQRI